MFGSSIQAFGQQVIESESLNPGLEVHHHQRQPISIIVTFGRSTRLHCPTTELFAVSYDGLVQPPNRLVVSYDDLSAFSSFFKVLNDSAVHYLSENIVLTNRNNISINTFIVVNEILPQQVRISSNHTTKCPFKWTFRRTQRLSRSIRWTLVHHSQKKLEKEAWDGSSQWLITSSLELLLRASENERRRGRNVGFVMGFTCARQGLAGWCKKIGEPLDR